MTMVFQRNYSTHGPYEYAPANAMSILWKTLLFVSIILSHTSLGLWLFESSFHDYRRPSILSVKSSSCQFGPSVFTLPAPHTQSSLITTDTRFKQQRPLLKYRQAIGARTSLGWLVWAQDQKKGDLACENTKLHQWPIVRSSRRKSIGLSSRPTFSAWISGSQVSKYLPWLGIM
jgi:hypothetical protein